ncbi:acyl-CoA oxidase [Dothidotthia symphoricarpi CBS 119687]|uniref:Acyl-coenzyme A oxidase n=1 Tax=Dothidotthia symphoricarpi CBS 119687 TaxID=1392245 RepID=A0A6A6A7L4_9PLEO|nr:acyl-CoA oxidase [Dothidotthia symphoricarpi CBS 119687]KAF2127143.1 acyl-CoA oxidase [Dothidotthia symphoricarpi CBS 119687]
MPDFTDRLEPAHDGTATLRTEWNASKLNPNELAKHLLDRDGFPERQEKELNLSRRERHHLGLARAKSIQRIIRREKWGEEEHTMAEYLTDEMSPCFLHGTMFGHGSNVRGLETTAKRDPVAIEFEIHSPYLTASKWWNGSMARTATHAIVVAQSLLPTGTTMSEYKNHGPQTFIVRIRDKKTHQPLPRIAVGDIGPKYGYAFTDNGYMLFDRLKVPRSTGARMRRSHPAVVYGSLTFLRGQIIMQARLVLARAVTVAVRYCAIRRQFRDRDSKSGREPEMKNLDYPTVHIRILPLLATTFVLHYTGEYMYTLYYRSRETMENCDFGPLAELHSATSELKSLCTILAAHGIETCRQAMGGHDFGGGSGLMIMQQVAAYLIEKMTAAVKHPQPPSKDPTYELFHFYLANRTHQCPQTFLPDGSIDDQIIVDMFKWCAAELARRAYHARMLHNLSRAYSEHILVSNFHSSFATTSHLTSPTHDVLRTCFYLHTLSTLDQSASSFTMSGAVCPASVYIIQHTILDLMTDLRPHAVRLVDAWAIPDWLLNSALGRFDGREYEELFDMAHRQPPLNSMTFNCDWRSDEIVLGGGVY